MQPTGLVMSGELGQCSRCGCLRSHHLYPSYCLYCAAVAPNESPCSSLRPNRRIDDIRARFADLRYIVVWWTDPDGALRSASHETRQDAERWVRAVLLVPGSGVSYCEYTEKWKRPRCHSCGADVELVTLSDQYPNIWAIAQRLGAGAEKIACKICEDRATDKITESPSFQRDLAIGLGYRQKVQSVMSRFEERAASIGSGAGVYSFWVQGPTCAGGINRYVYIGQSSRLRDRLYYHIERIAHFIAGPKPYGPNRGSERTLQNALLEEAIKRFGGDVEIAVLERIPEGASRRALLDAEKRWQRLYAERTDVIPLWKR